MSEWIKASERAPDEEARYFIVYRYNGAGRIEKPYIGDYFHDGGGMRWSGLPRDCEVVCWMPVPDWHDDVSGPCEVCTSGVGSAAIAIVGRYRVHCGKCGRCLYTPPVEIVKGREK